jgi:transcriptional regulator with GAF, ATPase, and Fis domain
VQEIVAAASSTLDPQEVLRTVLSSVRRIAPFDQAGVMLLDQEGQRLLSADMVGTGASPELVDKMKRFSIPIDETNSAFAYVVRKNRSFLLREIDEATVQAMSPSDRQVWEVTPNRPRALFINPIEIDHETVGVMYLGKTDGPFDLEEKDLATVQRYLPTCRPRFATRVCSTRPSGCIAASRPPKSVSTSSPPQPATRSTTSARGLARSPKRWPPPSARRR